MFVGYIDVRVFFPRNRETWLKKIYFITNFQTQVIKYTFSPIDPNCEKTSLWSLCWKHIWMVKIPDTIFDTNVWYNTTQHM